MIRKLIVCIILCLISVAAAFSISVTGKDESHPFDSAPMLQTFYDESDDGNMDFWSRCEISLLTVTQGKPLYSWFGHSAFLVTTPDGRNITYDYGTFSFNSEDFFVNFAFGRLWFVCLSSRAERQIEEMEQEGRSVTKVVLPLTAEQKKAVIEFLNSNVSYENRTYLYHHYNDNCATRLRDIIDFTTGGDFRRWAQGIPGMTFRQQASRALSKNPFVLWGLDFLQSGQIDKPATLWDEMFLPENLEKGVMAYYGLNNETVLDNSGNYPDLPEKGQSNILFSILMGLVLGGVSAALLLFRREKAYFIYSGIVDIIFAIMGSVLLFMMLFTNHDVTWFNENIIFVNPLLLVLAVLSFRKSRKVELLSRIILSVIAFLCILKLILPSVFLQANWPVIIVMALFHLPGCFRNASSSKRG
ncbi:MAG: DUF4105 domain-containing protein [Spirochaetales bacterium]|nr:DUF4105 domain-containing protein [Spirochaetales bacterium]MBR0521057.1 DUF4105 domain-containing protein [Spirochaetales bacterium]